MEFIDLDEEIETYFMVHTDTNGEITSSPKKAFLKDDVEWFFKKMEGKKILRVTPCHDAEFHGIDCLEDEERYGFFNSEADVRPGHAKWVNKEVAEKLYTLITKDVPK